MGFFESKKKYAPIIIVGCGDLGASLAEYLSKDEVVVIDNCAKAFDKLPSYYMGEGIIGDAVEIFVSNNIQIEKAAAVIAATNNDNTNILVAQIAKTIFAIPYVAARLHDLDRERIYKDLDIDIIFPARITAKAVNDFIHDAANTKEDAI